MMVPCDRMIIIKRKKIGLVYSLETVETKVVLNPSVSVRELCSDHFPWDPDVVTGCCILTGGNR